MYLDTLIAEKSAKESSVSYSELLSEMISSVEEISQSELNIVKAEFVLRQVGNEGADDWWAKIKAFFRKIWENVKRVIIKFIAWCKGIPDKVVVLWKKILNWWNTYGIETKIKNISDKIAKNKLKITEEAIEDFNNTDWGISNIEAIDSVIEMTESALVSRDGGTVSSIVQLIKNVSEINHGLLIMNVIIGGKESDIDRLATILNEDDEFTSSDFNEAVSIVVNGVIDIIEEYKDEDRTGEDNLTIPNVQKWFSTVKNGTVNKRLEVFTKRRDRVIRNLDAKHKAALSSFEKLYKEDDRDGVKELVCKLKILNYVTAASIVFTSKLSRLYAECLNNLGKKVIFALKAFKSADAAETAPAGGATPSPASPSSVSTPSASAGRNGRRAGRRGAGLDATGRVNPNHIGSAEDFMAPNAFSPMPRSVAKELSDFMKL